MSWFDELTKAKPTTATAAPKNWFDEVAKPGPSISPAERPLPYGAAEDVSKMASPGAQAVASLPTDPMARARYFASKRFPGVPVDKALDNYFYVNDRLAYRDPEGGAFFEEPDFRASAPLETASQIPRSLASQAGPALPMIGGTLGGISAIKEGPVGLLTGVPSSMFGGAVGDVVRQTMANQLTGEQKSLVDRGLQTGGAAMAEGFGQLVGNSFVRVLQFMGRTPTFDIPETTATRDAARKFGIVLTPGEETGNRTLLRRQKILANTTQGEDVFTKFYEGRNEQVGNAVDQVLNSISRETSPRMGAQAGVEGAQSALETANRALQAEARPLYRQAESGVVPIEQATGGMASERIKVAINAVRRTPEYKDLVAGLPDDSLVVIDAAKKWIDGRAGAAARAGNNTSASLWSQAAEELRTIADANVPVYGQARTVFEEGVPARTALQKGLVGDVAKLEGNDALRAGNIIFNPRGSSKEDVALAKDAFRKAGRMEDWDKLTRSWLQQQFADIGDTPSSGIPNIGGTWRNKIVGNKPKREILQAALDHAPGAMRDVDDLMLVLQATGRAAKGESITAFAQAGQRELAQEGRGMGPAIIETVEFWRTPSRVAQYWADVNTGKYAAKQAELLTTPEGRAVMRELRRLGPTSAGSVIALSHFLTAGGVQAAQNVVNPPRTGPVLPGATGQSPRQMGPGR